MDNYTFASYIKSKSLAIICCILCIVVEFFILWALGTARDGCILISLITLTFALIAFIADFIRRRNYYNSLIQVVTEIEKISLLPELINQAEFVDGQITNELIIKICNIGNLEQVALTQQLEDYRHYIELWIHEVKTPITAMKLASERIQGSDADSISKNIELVDSQVEQALYYARMSTLRNDYKLEQVKLLPLVQDAVKQNRYMLLNNAIAINIDIAESIVVIADKPWMVFILNQLISNSIKYGAKQISFTATDASRDASYDSAKNETDQYTLLEVKDDGWGIPSEDMPKIFDQAYTGTNGRTKGNATGMGLYLIANMCERMGIGIQAASERGVGTRILMYLPHDFRVLEKIR